MSALADWLQSVTVHEDMPDLEAEVPCWACDGAALRRILGDCAECGRLSRPFCEPCATRLAEGILRGDQIVHRTGNHPDALVAFVRWLPL